MWEKFLREIYSRKVYLIILFAFWSYIFIVFNPLNKENNEIRVQYATNRQDVIGTITEGKRVQQLVVTDRKGLKAIELFMATYARENDSSIEISIFDNDTQESLFNQIIDCREIKDNTYYTVDLPEKISDKGRNLMIQIVGLDGNEENSISIWQGKSESKENYKSNIDGVLLDYSLMYNLIYEDTGYIVIEFGAWFLVILASMAIAILLTNNIEKNFLLLSIILGGMILVLNPFPHAIDESTHFFRSYCISELNFNDTIVAEQIGEYMPSNYGEILESQLNLKNFYSNSEKWNQKFSDNNEFYVNPYMSSVIPINHSIAAIGVFLGSLLGLNAIGVILFGRIINYIVYIWCCYIAIKNMPKYKLLIFTISTLPMSIWLGASYSIDPVLLGSSLLFMSICMKYYFNNNNTKIYTRELVQLVICGCCIASVKYLVYAPILLLFFFIPQNVFGPKKYKTMISIGIGIGIGIFIWQIYLLKAFPFTENRNGDVDLKRQVLFMVNNISFTIRNFLDYFISYIIPHIENFNYQMAIPSIGKIIGLFAIFGSVLEKEKFEFKDKKSKRLLYTYIFIIISIYILSMLALYIGFTPVGKYGIDGLQTRYFLPILLLVMILISRVKVENKIDNYEQQIGFFMSIGLINTLAGILLSI